MAMIGGAMGAASGAAGARRRAQQQKVDMMLIEEEYGEDPPASESESDSAADESDPWWERLTKSTEFSLITNIVIVLNMVAIWMQADFPYWDFWLVNTLFLFFFVIELTLRLCTYGCYGPEGFFTNEDDKEWNIFDFTIVSMGLTDWASRFFVSDRSSATQFVTVIRILRILRVLRVLRVFKFARPLMRLIKGLMDSVAMVFYIVLFISVIILVLAIMCTTSIGQQADLWEDVPDTSPEDIRKMFGSMTNSSLTLFQFLTLDDWSNITRTIAAVYPLYYMIFILYILLTAFVILSLLTGTMAENMANVRVDEETDLERRKEKDVYKAFKDLDTNGNDFLTMNEFVNLHSYPDMEGELKVTLSEFEPQELFSCFDMDANGSLTWFEFKNGMLELRKGVSKKQYFKLQAMMQRVVEQVLNPSSHDNGTQEMSKEVEANVNSVADKVDDCDESLNSLENSLDDMLKELRELIRTKHLS